MTHVLLEEVKTTVTGDESGDLLSVLDELHADRLTNGGVRLLGLNSSAKRNSFFRNAVAYFAAFSRPDGALKWGKRQ